jgi:hypothetical protein
VRLPLAISGSISIAPDRRLDPSALAHKIREHLRAEGIIGEVTGSKVSFVNNRNFLQQWPFGRYRGVDLGEFIIEENGVHYQLYLTLSLVFAAALILLLLVLGLVVQSAALLAFVGIWVIVIVGGLSLLVHRIRRSLTELVNSR